MNYVFTLQISAPDNGVDSELIFLRGLYTSKLQSLRTMQRHYIVYTAMINYRNYSQVLQHHADYTLDPSVFTS